MIDQDGFPTAFYDDVVHSSIPQGALPIEDAQWTEFLENPGQRIWDGTNIVPGTPTVPDDNRWVILRRKRDIALASSDWTQIPDSPLTQVDKDAWAVWRQELRDIPQDYPVINDAEIQLQTLTDNPPA